MGSWWAQESEKIVISNTKERLTTAETAKEEIDLTNLDNKSSKKDKAVKFKIDSYETNYTVNSNNKRRSQFIKPYKFNIQEDYDLSSSKSSVSTSREVIQRNNTSEPALVKNKSNGLPEDFPDNRRGSINQFLASRFQKARTNTYGNSSKNSKKDDSKTGDSENGKPNKVFFIISINIS